MTDDDLDLPRTFHQWPLADRADYFAFYLKRDGCLKHLRRNIETDRDSDRLSVDELGRLLAILERNSQFRNRDVTQSQNRNSD